MQFVHLIERLLIFFFFISFCIILFGHSAVIRVQYFLKYEINKKKKKKDESASIAIICVFNGSYISVQCLLTFFQTISMDSLSLYFGPFHSTLCLCLTLSTTSFSSYKIIIIKHQLKINITFFFFINIRKYFIF